MNVSYAKPPMRPPASGPTIGTHHHECPALNTPDPHPAIAVNRRGPKSRAGLIAYPALNPNATPIATTSAPTITGAIAGAGGRLRRSPSAKITATRSAVPTI